MILFIDELFANVKCFGFYNKPLLTYDVVYPELNPILFFEIKEKNEKILTFNFSSVRFHPVLSLSFLHLNCIVILLCIFVHWALWGFYIFKKLLRLNLNRTH